MHLPWAMQALYALDLISETQANTGQNTVYQPRYYLVWVTNYQFYFLGETDGKFSILTCSGRLFT